MKKIPSHPSTPPTDSARLLRLLVEAVVVDTVIIGMNYSGSSLSAVTRWYTTRVCPPC